MESNKRLIFVLFLVPILSVIPLKVLGNVVFPSDTPTIEALIDAHKKMKKAEDLSIVQLTAIEETHRLTDKVANAYNKTRTILNKRLSDGMSYVKLATQISNATLKLIDLTSNYKDFTTLTYQHALKKPYVMVYYLRAHYQLEKEIKHLTKMITSFTVGINVLKSTMEEKYQILALIEASIGKLNRIIWHNDLVCRSILINGLKIYHIQDMLGKETQELITSKLIAKWYKEQDVKI